jgi:5-formyltetrahydrofolate cyclo-ligase
VEWPIALRITEAILCLPEWKNARSIGVFLPMEHEVNTLDIIKHSFQQKHTIFVPKLVPVTSNEPSPPTSATTKMAKKLVFVQLLDLEDLDSLPKMPPFGIREPEDLHGRLLAGIAINEHPLDVMIVPGIAFDSLGNRIGYGKGFVFPIDSVIE